MYIAARRQSNSTRMFGLVGTAAVIAMVGVVLVNMRETIVRPLAPPTTVFVPIDDPPVVEPTPVDVKPVDQPVNIPFQIPTFVPQDFTWDRTDAPLAPPMDHGAPTTPGTGVTPSSTPIAPATPGTRPVRIAGDAPEYPPASARAHESGTTTLSLCISKAGRVTQASVSSSSGYARLDNAALAWIRRERFKPATENGQPIDMCNHTLAYVWELPKR